MNVLELAKTRRDALAKEITKLEEFIAFGEELSRSGTSTPSQTSSDEDSSSDADDDDREPLPLRQFSTGG